MSFRWSLRSIAVGALLLGTLAGTLSVGRADDGGLQLSMGDCKPTSFEDVRELHTVRITRRLSFTLTKSLQTAALRKGPVLRSGVAATIENLDTGYTVRYQHDGQPIRYPADIVGISLNSNPEVQIDIVRLDQGRFRVTHEAWATWEHLRRPPVRAQKISEFTIESDERCERAFADYVDQLVRFRRGELRFEPKSMLMNRFCMDDHRLEILSCVGLPRVLCLENAPVTDRGLHAILGPDTKVLGLDLRGTRISSASVRRLAKHPSLGRLLLDGVPVTPEDLELFHDSPALNTLSVDSPHLEMADVTRLQWFRPWMKIVFCGEELPELVE